VNASRSRSSSGLPSSTVRTAAPSTAAASVRHDSTGRPSSTTVQLPQVPSPHATLVPVSPSRSRSSAASVHPSGTFTTCSWLFTSTRTIIASATYHGRPEGSLRAENCGGFAVPRLRYGVLSLPSTSPARRAPLERTIVPRGPEEPLMGFYSVTPLTPGGWTGLLDEAELPHHLRRLPVTIIVNGGNREVEARCLPMLAALAYLLKQRDGALESPSVRAWRLAARIVEQVARNGGQPPDLERFAGAFPSLAHAASFDMTAEEPEPTGAEEAVQEFVGAALRALATAVREPKTLPGPETLPAVIALTLARPAP